MRRLAPIDPSVPVRPLVVPSVPAEGESLMGLIAAATRANVLGGTQIILRDVGLDVNRPGHVGRSLGELAPRLAMKLGCDVGSIIERCHPPFGRDDGGDVVRYGPGAMRSVDLVFDRRRISPASLAIAGHHRTAWLCRHLPYCAESLELLVDRCDDCGAGLGWRQGWGIGVCEKCRRHVASTSRRMDPAHAEPFRRFAALISVTPDTRDAARAMLAPELAALSQPHLIDLILAVGTALGLRTAPSRPAMRAQNPVSHVEAIAHGMGMIDDWPERLRRNAAATYEEAEDAEARRVLSHNVRRLGDPVAVGVGVASLLHAAVPEAFGPMRRAMGGLRAPVVLAREVLVRSGIEASSLARIDAAGLLSSIEVGSGERRQRHYDARQIEEFVNHRRGSEPTHRLERLLGIPAYGVEQLVCEGPVVWEDLPAVLLVEPKFRIVTASANLFAASLERALRRDAPPGGAVPLWTVMRRRGGGAKAWGKALRRICDGSKPAWARRNETVEERSFVRRAMVLPVDFGDLEVGGFSAARSKAMPIPDTLCKEDACELLNLDGLTIRPVINAGLLPHVMDGCAIRIDKNALLELAKRLISAAEVAPVLGMAPHAVARHMTRHYDVATMPGGWLREQFDCHVRRDRERAPSTAPLVWTEIKPSRDHPL